MNYVDWGDTVRFANWLHNGQATGAQDLTTTEDGAYDLYGATSEADLMAVSREAGWKWALTSEDEWYKAAYHKNDGDTGNYFNYPTSNYSTPSNDLVDPDLGNNATFEDHTGRTISDPYWRTEVGAHENSESPYGTFDQGGNVWEWNEAIIWLYRGERGGTFSRDGDRLHASLRTHYQSFASSPSGGFRVSEVPEPCSLGLLALGGLAVLRRRSRRAKTLAPAQA